MAEKLCILRKKGNKNGFYYRGTLPSGGKILCGFKPTAFLFVDTAFQGSTIMNLWYDENISTTTFSAIVVNGTSATYNPSLVIGGSGSLILSVDNNGITINPQYVSYISANAFFEAVKA